MGFQYIQQIERPKQQQYQMDYIQNTDMMNKLVREVLKSRCYNYSDDRIMEIIQGTPDLIYQNFSVLNSSQETLLASLFSYQQCSDTCIIFMHGLGSTRLEGLTVLNSLPRNYSLCLFDFSGCGKSYGETVTYGNKEKFDVHAIVEHLRKKNYKKFVLWGRSMGAVATLLYAVHFNPQDTILLVLDSAFCSFQDISKELTNKKTNVPLFLIEFGVDILKTKLKNHPHDPFSINLALSASKCQIPALFLYSLSDEVINSQHTLKIINNYGGEYDRLQIQQSHNMPRTSSTIQRIFGTIEMHRTRTRKNNLLRSKTGINMLSSSSKPKRPSSTFNNRRSMNKITDRLLSGIGGVGLGSEFGVSGDLFKEGIKIATKPARKPSITANVLSRDYYC